MKYGFSNFSFEILEYCKPNDAISREQCYLNKLKPDYNIVETAGSTLGYKHTEKSIKKMRDFVLSSKVLARKQLATKNATAARMVPIIVNNTKTGGIQ